MNPVGTISMYKITHLISGGDKISSFSHYWQDILSPTGWGPAELIEICDFWHGLVGPLWKELANISYSMLATKVVFVQGTAYLDAVSTSAAVAGDVGTLLSGNLEAHGAETAVVIQRRTGHRGRHMRGRMFIPGIDESLNKNGYLTTVGEEKVADLCAVFTGNQEYVTESEHAFEFAARHYVNELVDSGGDPVRPNSFEVVTDTRYVNKLSTRKDRLVSANIIAR